VVWPGEPADRLLDKRAGAGTIPFIPRTVGAIIGGSARLLGFAPARDPRPPTFVFFGGRDPALGFSSLSQGLRAVRDATTDLTGHHRRPSE